MFRIDNTTIEKLLLTDPISSAFFTTKYQTNLSARFQEELDELLGILTNNNRCIIVLYGPAGSGKTTLMTHLADSLYTANIGFEGISANNGRIKVRNTDKEKTILFIDGLDELQNKDENLTDVLRSGYPKIVISLRTESIASSKESANDSSMRWENRCFNQLFSNSYFSTHPEQVFFRNILLNDISTIPSFLMWKAILEGENDVQRIIKTYEGFAQLVYEYGYGASFSKNFYIPKREIVVPKPEIIRGITFVNDSLIQQAKANPRIMYEFTPRQFEEMVCELFEKQGFHVSLTKQTHDGGKDLIVLRKDYLGECCVYMDCKKYRPDRPVGVGLVRELYGAVEADKVTAGRIVTTSYFSKEAIEFTETVRYRMSLMDFHEIVQNLERIT